jgi:ABC-type nitrate/sulfonate/bicarbonate transport system substrate-binding protein
MVDHVAFPYRSSSHLSLLHVIAESGAWEKYGLDVEYDRYISSSEAHRAVPAGDVEFVGGNHVSTYAHRARGDSWTYIGQTVNMLHHKLVVRPDSGIDQVADLRHKKVLTSGSHPALNDWLYLKQRGLDVDRDEVEIVNRSRVKKGEMDEAEGSNAPKKPKWELVRDGTVDATLLSNPLAAFAARAGLKVIDVEPLPMIHFTTLSTSQAFVDKHPDIVERFLKGILEGIAFFKTRRAESVKIIKERHRTEGVLDDEMAEDLYRELAQVLEPKLYPSMAAIANVYEEALRQDADAAKVNPLALWNLHFLRQLDDTGFVRNLYKQAKG